MESDYLPAWVYYPSTNIDAGKVLDLFIIKVKNFNYYCGE